MKYKPTHTAEVVAPEVVLNLWAYVDEAGYILRLAGKSYVMDGDDDEKLALLQKLSRADFFSAGWCKLRIFINSANLDERNGFILAFYLA